jgi:hypothetical protein
MGFIGTAPTVTSTAKMGPKDFIWLAALGTAARGPASVGDVCLAIDDIAGHLWTPASDVVIGCIEEMLRGGTLRLASDREPLFATTDSGRQAISLLLSHPGAGSSCPLGQVGLRMKLAFIDLVPLAERRRHLSGAIRTCESEIGDCERRCQICSAQGAFGRLWLDHETDRLRHDLSLLQAMMSQCGPAALSLR